MLQKHDTRPIPKFISAAMLRAGINKPHWFWAYVDVRDKNECWPWTGSCVKDGYGRFRFRKKLILAHKVAFHLHYGKPLEFFRWPDRLILHKCDNPICCNPFHLFLGTHQRNMADKKERKRFSGRQGETNPRAILNRRQVLQIRKARGRKTTQILARNFKVSKSTIDAIWSGKNWGWL